MTRVLSDAGAKREEQQKDDKSSRKGTAGKHFTLIRERSAISTSPCQGLKGHQQPKLPPDSQRALGADSLYLTFYLFICHLSALSLSDCSRGAELHGLIRLQRSSFSLPVPGDGSLSGVPGCRTPGPGPC